MKALINFLKGIVAGIGGIAPGLSGSVLLVILGLYEDTVHAIGTFFQNFRKNVRFLLPIVVGLAIGVLAFSKLVDYLLENFEFQTRYAFLGLVVGTVPLFYQQTKKNGPLRIWHYALILAAAATGLLLFGANPAGITNITDPNLWQSVLLGVAVAGSSIVPGVDSAVILSTLGLYELYVSSLANFDLAILLPAGIGLVVGALAISFIMNLLLKKAYTITFSVIFGMFLSIIPNVLSGSCNIFSLSQGLLAAAFVVPGFAISFYLSDISGNNQRLKKLFRHRQ